MELEEMVNTEMSREELSEFICNKLENGAGVISKGVLLDILNNAIILTIVKVKNDTLKIE